MKNENLVIIFLAIYLKFTTDNFNYFVIPLVLYLMLSNRTEGLNGTDDCIGTYVTECSAGNGQYTDLGSKYYPCVGDADFDDMFMPNTDSECGCPSSQCGQVSEPIIYSSPYSSSDCFNENYLQCFSQNSSCNSLREDCALYNSLHYEIGSGGPLPQDDCSKYFFSNAVASPTMMDGSVIQKLIKRLEMEHTILDITEIPQSEMDQLSSPLFWTDGNGEENIDLCNKFISLYDSDCLGIDGNNEKNPLLDKINNECVRLTQDLRPDWVQNSEQEWLNTFDKKCNIDNSFNNLTEGQLSNAVSNGYFTVRNNIIDNSNPQYTLGSDMSCGDQNSSPFRVFCDNNIGSQAGVTVYPNCSVDMNDKILQMQGYIQHLSADQNYNNSELLTLQSEYNTINSQLDSMQNDEQYNFNNLQHDYNNFSVMASARFTGLDTEISNIRGRIEVLEGDDGTTQGDVGELRNALTALQGTVGSNDTATQSQITGLQGRLDTMMSESSARFTTQETEISGIRSRIEALEGDDGTTQADYDQLQIDLTALGTRTDDTDTATQGQITGLQGRLDTMMGEVSARFTTQETEIGGIRSRIEALEGDGGTTQADYDQLQTDLTALGARTDDAATQSEITLLQGILDTMMSEASAQRADITREEAEISRLRLDVSAQQASASAQQADITREEAEISSLTYMGVGAIIFIMCIIIGLFLLFKYTDLFDKRDWPKITNLVGPTKSRGFKSFVRGDNSIRKAGQQRNAGQYAPRG